MKLEAADRWLKGRLQMPTVLRSDGLARLAPAIRAHAFFSAGVAQGHVLAKLREVSDAFTRGEMDLATARKKLKDWLGKKEEPGSKEDRQMGRLWSTARLNLILRQNARMAHAVGEWEQGQSDISRKLFPYWRYVASVSESPRGSHRAYAGKVWRKEDPIWHRIFPPWDFNCKCSVEEVAADEVEPDEVEPTTTDGRMPEVAESGFAFDPAEALRVYDPELIQDETLRGNVEKRLEEMGCARREDGKLEMPVDSLPGGRKALDDSLRRLEGYVPPEKGRIAVKSMKDEMEADMNGNIPQYTRGGDNSIKRIDGIDEKSIGVNELPSFTNGPLRDELFLCLRDAAKEFRQRGVPGIRAVLRMPLPDSWEKADIANLGNGILCLNEKWIYYLFHKSRRYRPPTCVWQFFSKKKRLQCLVWHEVGHHIHHRLLLEDGKKELIKKLEEAYARSMEKHKDKAKLKSYRNVREWVAENFCAWKMGKKKALDEVEGLNWDDIFTNEFKL